jgi:hypothetical protein
MNARALIAVLWMAACGPLVEYEEAAPADPIHGTTRPGTPSGGVPTPAPNQETDAGTASTDDPDDRLGACSQVDGGFCFGGGQCCGQVCCAVDQTCCDGQCVRFGVNTPFCPNPI